MIHAVHSNNMSDMGGLRKSMPVTFWTMLIGSLALAGVFPLAGFWSKDELLVVAEEEHVTWLFVVFLLTAVITAFYTTRMVLLTFFGEYKGHAHPHESPATMTGPLVALAAATLGVGLLGAPQLGAVFGKWVFFEAIHEAVFVPWIALLSTAGGLLGLFAGYALYKERKAQDPLQAPMGVVWNVLENRYYIDAFYMRAIVRPVRDTWSSARQLVQPARARRDRERRRALDARVRPGGRLVRPHVIDGHRQRRRRRRRADRQRAEVPAVGQRAVVRGRAVRGRDRARRRVHPSRLRGSVEAT